MLCPKCNEEMVEIIINKMFICQNCGNNKEVLQ